MCALRVSVRVRLLHMDIAIGSPWVLPWGQIGDLQTYERPEENSSR